MQCTNHLQINLNVSHLGLLFPRFLKLYNQNYQELALLCFYLIDLSYRL